MRETRILKQEYGIRMNLKEIKWEDADWIDLPRNCGKWHAVVNIVMKFQYPKHSGNFLTSSFIIGF